MPDGDVRMEAREARLTPRGEGTKSLSACTNGPDKHGEWPCDPVDNKDGTATCSACGWTGGFAPDWKLDPAPAGDDEQAVKDFYYGYFLIDGTCAEKSWRQLEEWQRESWRREYRAR